MQEKSPLEPAALERAAEITRIEPHTSEEISMLTSAGPIRESGSNQMESDQAAQTQFRASQLLNPWIAGDRRQLDYEMRRWREGNFALDSNDGRAELLSCLVQQMMDEPDLFAPRSEKMHLGVWIDLLMHLAHPDQTTSALSAD